MVKRQAYDVAKDRVKIGYFTELGADINGVIHVGANDGYEIQWYLAMGIQNIMAFEPLPSAYELLKAYEGAAIKTFNFGLGNKNEKLMLNVTQGDGQGSTFLEMVDNPWGYEFIDRVECEIKRFEDWYMENYSKLSDIRHYNCLVVDTEGMELGVLQGFGRYLDHFKYLNIECRSVPVYKDSPLAQEVINFLAGEGFTQATETPNLDDILFVRSSKKKRPSDIAVTFPAKIGDCLWALPTIREVARKHGPVDLYVMDHLKDIAPIIERQEYINHCIPMEEWDVYKSTIVGGPQPAWVNPPLPQSYTRVFQLGYRTHPLNPLIDHTLESLNKYCEGPYDFYHPVLPFLTWDKGKEFDLVIGFSIYYETQRENFINQLMSRLPGVSYREIWYDPWDETMSLINSCKVFLGDNSALHVLAHGLGKPVILAESNAQRRQRTFLCPYGREYVYDCTNILERVDDYANKIKELL